MNCPRCREGFAAPAYNETEYKYCLYCNGAWIEYGQLLRLLPIDQVDSFFYSLAASNPGTNPKCCPSCKQYSLQPFVYGSTKLDGCPVCQGVYFDQGEAGQILPDLDNFDEFQALSDAKSAYQFFRTIQKLLRSLKKLI